MDTRFNEKTALLTETVINIQSLEDLPEDVLNVIASQLPYKKDLYHLRLTGSGMNKIVEKNIAGQLARDAIKLQPSNFKNWAIKNESSIRICLAGFFGILGTSAGGYGGETLGALLDNRYPPIVPDDDNMPPFILASMLGSASGIYSATITLSIVGGLLGLAAGVAAGAGVSKTLTRFGLFSKEEVEGKIQKIHETLKQPVKELSKEEFYASRFSSSP